MRKPHPLACYACRGAGCDQCQHLGLACPACHGRRLRYGRVCAVCCEGNQVHPLRERRAIRAELVRLAAVERRALRRSA